MVTVWEPEKGHNSSRVIGTVAKGQNRVKCKVEFHSENLFLQVETTFTKPFIQWTESSRKRVETRCSILFRL